MIHDNLADAIREAQHLATLDKTPIGLCYAKGDGWKTYQLTAGTLHEPEFICFGQGTLPAPLTDIAAEAWRSLLRSLIH